MSRRIALLFILIAGCSTGGDAEDGSPDGGGVDPAPDAAPGGECLPAETPCDDAAQCCDGRYCADNSLGQVCCGGVGAACNTPDGTDCCAHLVCEGGVCGGAFDPGQPGLVTFPIRGPHNTGYEAPSTGDPSLWSCDAGSSNSDFGGAHLGVDLWAARGTPVVATVPGTLVYTGYSQYSGNKVTVRTDGGWYHFNCHLDTIAPGMVDGVRVEAGTVIGTVGNTGTASNGVVHLHYSIYPNNDYDQGVDPWPHLHAVEWDVCD
jgi:hypothetical protein